MFLFFNHTTYLSKITYSRKGYKNSPRAKMICLYPQRPIFPKDILEFFTKLAYFNFCIPLSYNFQAMCNFLICLSKCVQFISCWKEPDSNSPQTREKNCVFLILWNKMTCYYLLVITIFPYVYFRKTVGQLASKCIFLNTGKRPGMTCSVTQLH